MRKIVLLAITLFLPTFTLSAWAQDKAAELSLRANVQDGFIRLVFSGATLPQADVIKTGDDTLKITFTMPVKIDNLAAAEGVSPLTRVTAGDAETLIVKTGDLARFRPLSVGNRLFIDLFTKTSPKAAVEGNAATAAPIEKPLEKPAEEPVTKTQQNTPETPVTSLVADGPTEVPVATATEVPVATATQKDVSGITPVAREIAEIRAALPQPPVDVLMPAVPVTADAATPAAMTPGPPFAGNAVITIGSTQGLAMAAFQRAGYLWIVMSQENLTVPPQVSGTDAAALGQIEKVSIDGGSAYRIKMPPGAYVRAEGAGLVWRFYISGTNPKLRSVNPERIFSDTAQGPMLRIPFNNAVSALRLPDPVIGDDLAVITVARGDQRLVNSDIYVDFDLLPAIVGAVVRPKADGMRIAVLPTEVTVSRQGGLRLSATGPRAERSKTPVGTTTPANPAEAAPTTIFNFQEWALGGPKQYLDMRRSIDERIATAPEDSKLPELINGAKFMLAQGLPQEANGFLQMSLTFLPALRDSAEFQALHGAVQALIGENDLALAALQAPGLEKNDEMAVWRAYALSRAGKLPEAQQILPKKALSLVSAYPERLRAMVLLPLIEAVLSRGDVGDAAAMVDAYDKASGATVDMDRDNAIAYYRGRIAQLRGDTEASSEYYREAAEGVGGPYPVRATLALVERGLSAKTIGRDDAIRKLERFRYGWRGDNLESDVLERLGLVYVTGGEQRRGLTILRDAATQASDPATRDKLVAVMQKAFRELFSGKTREKMTPLESAAVAAEFAELMPAGGEGESITMTIADQMVAVDLLERAADMIEPMVGRTEKLPDAIRYASRAAAIRILNDQPQDALKILDKALQRPDAQAAKSLTDGDTKSFALLRAKAKAEMKQTDAALAELAALPEDAETLRLQADIAWAAQRWPVAADALGKLVATAGLSATRPVTTDQAQMILNQALALNLSGDTTRLESLRTSYGDIMRRSELSQAFQLVTRTAQEATLADRETLLKLVSEVNMFKDVLDTYKAQPEAPAAKAGQPTAAADQKAASPAKPESAAPAQTGQPMEKSN